MEGPAAFIQDQNAEWEDGYFPITISNAQERRVSAAICYLKADLAKMLSAVLSVRSV